jgi:hypothetical protein
MSLPLRTGKHGTTRTTTLGRLKLKIKQSIVKRNSGKENLNSNDEEVEEASPKIGCGYIETGPLEQSLTLRLWSTPNRKCCYG